MNFNNFTLVALTDIHSYLVLTSRLFKCQMIVVDLLVIEPVIQVYAISTIYLLKNLIVKGNYRKANKI